MPKTLKIPTTEQDIFTGNNPKPDDGGPAYIERFTNQQILKAPEQVRRKLMQSFGWSE